MAPKKATKAKAAPAKKAATKAAPAKKTTVDLSREALKAMSWANASDAEAFLKKHKVDREALNLVLLPGETSDRPYELIDKPASDKPAKPASKPASKASKGKDTSKPAKADNKGAGEAEGDGADKGAEGEADATSDAEKATTDPVDPNTPVLIVLPEQWTFGNARQWAGFNAPRFRQMVEIRHAVTGELLRRVDGKEMPKNAGDGLPKLPTRGTLRRRVVNSDRPGRGRFAEAVEAAAKLAMRAKGVLRTEANPCYPDWENDQPNWKTMLERYAEKHGMGFKHENNAGEGPRYYIIKR